LVNWNSPMKTLLTVALVLGFATSSFADIQDPPSNDYGPTRKLGRGLSNLVFGVAELPATIAKINEREGNSAAAGYGVVRGLGRSYMRVKSGLFEFLTFPFPTTRRTYYPLLRSDIPYIHAGYQEFPPELGNESKYPYVRMY
jgi:putative exosortase-associated protein (TIGR04073 family)